MQIQVHTDNHTSGSAGLTKKVDAIVADAMERFGDRITRVEVHLTDENGRQKSGDGDKRCVMEARLAGLQPITVSAQGSDLMQAVHGAVDKLEKTIERTLGRLDDTRGRTSFTGNDTE